MTRWILALIGAGLFCAGFAAGQVLSSTVRSSSWTASTRDGVHGSLVASPPALPIAVTGAPYSGDQVSEHVQTLADGTRLTRKMGSVRMYRDSQGRTRREWRPFNAPEIPDAPLVIEIIDPVSGVGYLLDTVGKVAHRMALQKARAGAALPSGSTPAASTSAALIGVMSRRGEVKQEDLGTKLIEGVLAQGERITSTVPTGAQGNDRPIVNVMETWRSPELKMPVLSISDMPASGKQTTRFENLSQLEPNPLLFLPPADYQVVEETGQFTINYP